MEEMAGTGRHRSHSSGWSGDGAPGRRRRRLLDRRGARGLAARAGGSLGARTRRPEKNLAARRSQCGDLPDHHRLHRLTGATAVAVRPLPRARLGEPGPQAPGHGDSAPQGHRPPSLLERHLPGGRGPDRHRSGSRLEEPPDPVAVCAVAGIHGCIAGKPGLHPRAHPRGQSSLRELLSSRGHLHAHDCPLAGAGDVPPGREGSGASETPPGLERRHRRRPDRLTDDHDAVADHAQRPPRRRVAGQAQGAALQF